MKNYRFEDPFLKILPTIDVHGYTRDTVYYPISDFLNDNIKLKNYKVLIIHGIGERVLLNEIHLLFKKDRRVRKIYMASNNIGCTIIELNA